MIYIDEIIMNLKSYLNLAGYSVVHGIVDLSCAAIVFGTLLFHGTNVHDVFIFVIVYNLLAFALQAPFGLLVDKFQVAKESALIGCLILLSAFFFFDTPALVVILSGLGNAFFHVWGWSISLNFSPQKATAPGIFVAPGALWLAIGILIWKGGWFVAWPFIVLLVASCVFIILSKLPNINYKTEYIKPKVKYFELVILLLLLSVSIRSLYGLAAAWKADVTLLFILTSAIVLGKALWGIVWDKFGWTRTAIVALVISAPLLAFFPSVPALAILWAFLFQMTMPITLTALSNMLPWRSATAFGLTVLALIIGILPTYIWAKWFLGNKRIILTIVFISAISLLVSFRFLNNYFKDKLKINL